MEKKTYFMVRNRVIAKFHTCMCAACLLLGGSIRYDREYVYFDLPESIVWQRLVMRTFASMSQWSYGDLMRKTYTLHDAQTQARILFHLSEDGHGFNYYVTYDA